MWDKKLKLWIVSVVLVLLMIVLSGCSAKRVGGQEEILAEPGTLTFSIWGDGTELEIDPSDTDVIWYDVNTLTTVYPITVSVADDKGYKIKVNGMELREGEEIEFQLEKLGHDIGIPIEITDQANNMTVTKYIRTLNTNVDVRTNGEGEGLYYFTTNNYYCQMNGEGDIIFYGYAWACGDFKPHKIDGRTYYTVIYGEGAFDVANVTGAVMVLDETYEVVDQIKGLNSSQGMPEGQPLDTHEVVMLDIGHYIIESYVPKRVTNIPDTVSSYSPFGSRVIAAVVQEIKDGELIFQWDSTDYPELYGLSEQNNDFTNSVRYYEDYVHLNSIEVDPADQNLILSLRNMSTILKISRDTGDIMWKLGGPGDEFGLSEEQKCSAQHFARVTGRGTITVFDNGMVMPEGEPNPFVDEYHTRVVEYQLDETNKILTAFYEYSVPGTCSPIMGSAQLLDPSTNTFLVGWGGRRAGTPLFSEVDFSTNTVIFEVFDQGGNITEGVSYRAYKSMN